MSLSSLALFLHVTGALLLFVTLTVEGIALRLLRRAATSAEAAGASAMLRVNRIVGPISAIGVLVPGLYMTATNWGAAAWIVVALISWALYAPLGVRGVVLGSVAGTLVMASSPHRVTFGSERK